MKFSDLLFNTELFELAYQRKEILSKCFDLSPQICKHIVKLCCFINPIDVKGHLKSLNIWLGDIEDLKLKSNSRLDYKSYYDEIWNKFIDSKEDLERIFNKLKTRAYSNLPIRKVNFNDLYDNLCKLMKEVSRDIETDDLNNFDYYLDKYNIEYK